MSDSNWMLEGREIIPLRRVVESGQSTFGSRPAFRRLVWPVCGSTNQHTGEPQTVSIGTYESGWGGRGSLLIGPVEGECGHLWEMCFGFHKGETFAFVRTPLSEADESPPEGSQS
ncbi:MAG TPA: hypothetical protein VFE09_00800 [Rubrobacteraceae bacterium]|nr:hypothetical protein [Rubrobacteraceae bacterium]